MSLTPEEIETLMNGDKSKKTLNFYTLESYWINKFKKAGTLPTRIGKDGEHYYDEIDRSRITIRKESTGRKPMSQENKDAFAIRVAAGREAKKNGTSTDSN